MDQKSIQLTANTGTNPMDVMFKNDSHIPKIYHKGDIVEGKVISVQPDEVLIDLGAKSEGVVTGKELRETSSFLSELAKGDTILTYVISSENEDGQVALSLKKANFERRWRELEEFQDSEIPVEGKVVDCNRGGLIVDVGLRGFVPISQIASDRLQSVSDRSTGEVDDLQKLVGQTMQVRIIEADRVANKLIFSEKAAAEKRDPKEMEKILNNLTPGKIVEGKIVRIMPFGILVDLGGIEGMVHISEISWDRIKSPSDHYSLNDKVKVMVLNVDQNTNRITLSVKQMLNDPWQTVLDKYAVGQTHKGVVTRAVSFGYFVRLEKGIDGLIHVSEIPPEFNNLQTGDEVEFTILSIEPGERKMALTLKSVKTKEEPDKEQKDVKEK